MAAKRPKELSEKAQLQEVSFCEAAAFNVISTRPQPVCKCFPMIVCLFWPALQACRPQQSMTVTDNCVKYSHCRALCCSGSQQHGLALQQLSLSMTQCNYKLCDATGFVTETILFSLVSAFMGARLICSYFIAIELVKRVHSRPLR